MKVEYGPPAPRGVTTMMAVGDVGPPPLSDRVNAGLLISAGIAGLGWLVGSDVAKLGGLGATVAFWSLRKHV